MHAPLVRANRRRLAENATAMAMASMIGMGGAEASKAFQKYLDSLTADRVVKRLNGPQDDEASGELPDLMTEDEQDQILKRLQEQIANR